MSPRRRWLARAREPGNRVPEHPLPAQPDDRGRRGIEFAWRVHSAQEAWTAKVDAKAALYLATQTAVLAAMFAAFASGKPLDHLDGPNHGFAILGTAVSVAAVLMAGGAVVPMLNRRSTLKATFRENLIYFGHLKYWTASDLRERLSHLDEADELSQLSIQLIALSCRNWTKHVLLRAALLLGATGSLTVMAAYLQERICG